MISDDAKTKQFCSGVRQKSFFFLICGKCNPTNKKVSPFVGSQCILWGYWYPLYRTTEDSVYQFSKSGWIDRHLRSFITCLSASLDKSFPPEVPFTPSFFICNSYVFLWSWPHRKRKSRRNPPVWIVPKTRHHSSRFRLSVLSLLFPNLLVISGQNGNL